MKLTLFEQILTILVMSIIFYICASFAELSVLFTEWHIITRALYASGVLYSFNFVIQYNKIKK